MSQSQQIARLYWIDAQIRAGRYPNPQAVVDYFHVSERTAYNDRNRLLDELHAPLRFDGARGGWYYTDPSFVLPFLALSELESATLRRSLLAAQEYLSPTDAHVAGQLFELLAPYIAKSRLQGMESLGGAIQLTPQGQYTPELLAVCRQAVQNRQRLWIRYYSAHRNEVTARTVQPYHLHTFQGEPHLIGWCELRNEFRQFFLGRIQTFTLLEPEAAFARREAFRVETYLEQGLALQHGKELVQVRVRFSAYQARWIRERRYHPSQRCEELPDGGLILTLEVAGIDEVQRWLLGYGAEAEVLEPAALRASIAEEVKKLGVIYGLDAH